MKTNNSGQIIKKCVSSPLRYPGGKSRAVSTIRQYIPEDIDAICSPFIGGGSIELSLAADGIKVYGADVFSPLIDFWKELKKNPVSLSKIVRGFYPLSRTKFYALQKSYTTIKDKTERAAIFYVLNRASYSGTTLSGGMSPEHPRFTLSGINKLRDYCLPRNFNIRCCDYLAMLKQHDDKFLYLDPPYANGGKLYGQRGDCHAGFNHEQLAEVLHKRDGWILSYNDCTSIRKMYKGYKFVKPEWAYGMNGNKKSKEILILNA